MSDELTTLADLPADLYAEYLSKMRATLGLEPWERYNANNVIIDTFKKRGVLRKRQ